MLYILTPIFCVLLLGGAVFSFSLNNKVSANADVKTRAAYLNLDGGANILNAFEGAQKESVYFGKNVSSDNNNGGDIAADPGYLNTGTYKHEGAIKWRVLKKNDDKYGKVSNNLLLFADYQLGLEWYNGFYNNPNYAFWGTSLMRAVLNGGSYAPITSSKTAVPSLSESVAPANSYFGKIFTSQEKAAVSTLKDYTTDLIGSNMHFYINSITSTSDERSKYNINKLNATDYPTAQYAQVISATGSVQEISTGDKLTLLDYYDVNNLEYGFGDDMDGDGDADLSYASNLNSAWKTLDYLPSYSEEKSLYSDYLTYTDLANDYWLRNADRCGETQAAALSVTSAGRIYDVYVDWYAGSSKPQQKTGIRPAFVMDTTKIAYATTEIPGNSWTNMTSVPTTPEYKLYVKDDNYTNATNNAKAVIGVKDNALQIKYNNPVTASGGPVTDGNLVVLLSPKSATGGEVDYQQAIAMDANATSSKSVLTTVSLPAGVSLDTHDVTLMYTTAKGSYYTENIYCNYTVSTIDAPQNITVTYNNNSKWITDLSGAEKPDWLDLDIYNNSAYMSVKSIEYTDNLPADDPDKKTSATVTTSDIKAAGTYKVTMTLVSGLKWTGESTAGGDKSFNIIVKKASPNVTVQTTGTLPTYAPDKLSEIGIGLKSGGTAGTVKWKDGDQRPKIGTNNYDWEFTPTDTNNYESKTDKLPLTFSAREIASVAAVFTPPEGGVFTNTTEATLRSCTVVTITYKGTPLKTEETTTYEFIIDNDGESNLVEGDNYFKVRVIDANAGNKKVTSALVKIEDVKKLGYESIDSLILSGKTFTYPVTADDIIAAITSVTLNRNDGDSTDITDSATIKSVITLADDSDLTAGTGKSFTFKIAGVTGGDKTLGGFIINKGTFTPTVTFGNDTVTYDGSAHKIEATVSGLPTGLTLTPAYTVTGSSTTYDADGYTNAGTYNYSVTFTHTDPNYEQYTTASTATLTINKASYTMPTGYDLKKQVTYTGSAISLPANWITGLPNGVTVKYCEADGTTAFADKTAVGNYTVKAVFSVADSANYNVPDPVTLTFEITNKKIYNLNVTFAGDTVTYDGQPHTIAIEGDLPDGVSVAYFKADGTTPFTGATNVADSGTVIARFTHNDPEYADIPDMTATLTIEKADYDMSGVTFEDKTVTYNGAECTLEIGGVALPEWITVSYSVEGQSGTSFTESGVYTFVAKFTHSNANYNAIEDMTAKLTISDAVVTGISAKVEDGAKFTTANTLDDLKVKIKAEIEYNNGTKEEVAVDSLTLTCDTLREGEKFDVGTQTITIKYTDENGTEHTTTVTVTVAKAKVALPVYKGTLSYTGDTNNPLKPTAADFDGFDGSIMSLSDKTQGGVNAGAYKAVFALKDGDRYEWATSTSLKKSVFAAVVFDGETEIALEANEAAVDWNIAKAKISAVTGEDGKPVFKSEGVSAAILAQAVGLKFYKDEACTQEIAADELDYETTYYLQADLLDSANFALENSVAEVVSVPYTTPAKELTFWEKVVKFLTSKQMGLVVWLWIIIALVALILLITIIALAARASKNKKRRLAEEKAERERKEEERERREEERREREEERRREEREERMARMSQPQMQMPAMMPQMMPQMQMPQPQPQYAPQPQTVQPVMGGGSVDSAQITRIETELATLKAAQAAKDLAELKAEQAAMRSDLNALRGSEQTGGISIDAMTEIMTAALKNVLATATQQAIAGQHAQPAQLTDGTTAPAAPAAAQVPPDAVMTTVTTTKIDTTKKAQNGQGNAQATRTTRSFVPPMPVDDGRVFDVGGFYKPADPVDLVDDDVDNK